MRSIGDIICRNCGEPWDSGSREDMTGAKVKLKKMKLTPEERSDAIARAVAPAEKACKEAEMAYREAGG